MSKIERFYPCMFESTCLQVVSSDLMSQHGNSTDNDVIISMFQSSTVYRGVLISGGWNRGVPLYTEVSSFQEVGIEGFHCIQRCPHFRRLE